MLQHTSVETVLLSTKNIFSVEEHTKQPEQSLS